MMTLNDVIKAVQQLSPDEVRDLRSYLEQYHAGPAMLEAGTMNVDELLAAARAIRNDMTESDFDEMLDAMNEEYVEPVNDDEWPL